MDGFIFLAVVLLAVLAVGLGRNQAKAPGALLIFVLASAGAAYLFV